MKYPVIYIKGKGNRTARFSEMVEGRMYVAGDIGSAMRTLTSLRTEHAFILYEQRDPASDLSDIRLLNSWPGGGIVLITSGELTDTERREYLRAGVNSAVSGDIQQKDFLRTLQFMGDYAFTHKPVAQNSPEVQIFRMPLWKRAFDIAASFSAILLLSPLLIVVAAAIKLDSRGPVVYKSKRVGSNYRIFDFLKFRSMRTDADRRLKELGELNQYAARPQETDSGKMVLDEEEMRKLVEDTGTGILYADDLVIDEEVQQQHVETEQENAFVKIENDPRITRL
ncbi:MAG: sugar transferase, partial [Alistipes sp.]|nr:sugar transferase [Alistipes sp.]